MVLGWCCRLGRINALFGKQTAFFGSVTALLGIVNAFLGKLSALLRQNGAVSLRSHLQIEVVFESNTRTIRLELKPNSIRIALPSKRDSVRRWARIRAGGLTDALQDG